MCCLNKNTTTFQCAVSHKCVTFFTQIFWPHNRRDFHVFASNFSLRISAFFSQGYSSLGSVFSFVREIERKSCNLTIVYLRMEQRGCIIEYKDKPGVIWENRIKHSEDLSFHLRRLAYEAARHEEVHRGVRGSTGTESNHYSWNPRHGFDWCWSTSEGKHKHLQHLHEPLLLSPRNQALPVILTTNRLHWQ